MTPFLDPLATLAPPMPASDAARAEHTRLRRRILTGRWREDLRERIRAELQSSERAEAWGEPDLTGDLLTPTCEALAQLYAPDAPRVTPPAAPGAAEVLGAMAGGGYWDLMIRVQRDTIGLREMLVRVDAYTDAAGVARLAYRPVPPDLVTASAHPSARDVPVIVREAVRVPTPHGGEVWGWDEWDVSDLAAPAHRLYDDGDTPILVEEGEAYPYRDAAGVPVLPWVLYHAERTGYLWDAWAWLRVLEGSLRLGVLWTYFGHVIRNAGFPIRYIAGYMVSGSTDERTQRGTTATPPRVRVPADPAFALFLTTGEDNTTPPVIGSWGPGASPMETASAIEVYERRVTSLAGIDPASVQRISGDPRSGYAISVSHEAQAEARRRFAPQFLRGDTEAIRVSAAVLGSALGLELPGAGYAIEYGPPAPPPNETPAKEGENAEDDATT